MNKRRVGLIVTFLLLIGGTGVYAAGDEFLLSENECNSTDEEWAEFTEQEWDEVYDYVSNVCDSASEKESARGKADVDSNFNSTNWDDFNLEVRIKHKASTLDQEDRNKTLGTQQPEKPYTCSECGYATARKYYLGIHKRTHSGERPYKCDKCEYAAARKDTLEEHKRTHTEEKPYTCDKCDYATGDRSSLYKHKKKHAGESHNFIQEKTSRTRGVHRFSPLD